MNRQTIFLQNLTLAVQAGGFSKRMGKDKALLPFNKMTMIEHVIQRGRSLTDDILVTTNKLEEYQFLGVPLFSDQLDLNGSLVGIHTALNAAKRSVVAVIACDMPFFSPGLLAYQAQMLIENNVDVVVPRWQNYLEPLHAVYRKETGLAVIEKPLAEKKFAILDWYKYLHVLEVDEQKIDQFDPNHLAFINTNTPQDYENAKIIFNNSSNSLRSHSEKEESSQTTS